MSSRLALAVGALMTVVACGSSQTGHVASQSIAPSSEPSPRPAATPEPTAPEITFPPVPSVAPAQGDVLALAGRDGTPGMLYCGNEFAFDFEALGRTGAELLQGSEYDALRDSTVTVPTREVGRRDGAVAFLLDNPDPGPWNADYRPYLYVVVRQVGGTWVSGGGGGCLPKALSPPRVWAATWTLDPAFDAPGRTTDDLHLLVSELECSSGRSATGRIGPAFVITDRHEVHVQLLVQRLPGGQDCSAAPSTPARLRLPEPLGDRALRDSNAHLLNPSGG
jgi:hypothetical protein